MSLKVMRKISIAMAASAAFIGLAWAHGPHDHGAHETAASGYGEPGDPAKPSREVIVVMAEADGRMLFVPNRFEVRKGEQVRFKFRNDGALAHEFILGTQAELDEHADLMAAMPDMKHADPNSLRLEPTGSGDLLWRFTAAGEFPFACLIPGHREAGMTGTIVVR